MGDTFTFRQDFDIYEVLMNEGGCEVEGREAKKVEKLWGWAASRVDSPSQITICQEGEKYYVGYHFTLSDLTPWRVVRLGVVIGGWNGLVNADLLFDGSEAYVMFFTPERVLRQPKLYKKWLASVDAAIEEVWGIGKVP